MVDWAVFGLGHWFWRPWSGSYRTTRNISGALTRMPSFFAMLYGRPAWHSVAIMLWPTTPETAMLVQTAWMSERQHNSDNQRQVSLTFFRRKLPTTKFVAGPKSTGCPQLTPIYLPNALPNPYQRPLDWHNRRSTPIRYCRTESPSLQIRGFESTQGVASYQSPDDNINDDLWPDRGEDQTNAARQGGEIPLDWATFNNGGMDVASMESSLHKKKCGVAEGSPVRDQLRLNIVVITAASSRT